MKHALICIFHFCSIEVKASGFPVVDTNQLISEIKDSAYMVDSIQELMEEIGFVGQEAVYLAELQMQLNAFQLDIDTLRSFNEDVSDVTQSRSMRGMILADRIRRFSQYLRKLKKIIATATTLRARPQAVLVSLQLLEQGRQRENDRTNAQLMAAEEVEKIQLERAKVRDEIMRKQQNEHEKSLIFGKSENNTSFKPLKIESRKKRSKTSGLI